MNQRDMLIEDFVSKLDGKPLVIFGIRRVDDDKGMLGLHQTMDDELQFLLTKACLQSDEIYAQVKTLFMRLGQAIEDVQREKAITMMDKDKLN